MIQTGDVTGVFTERESRFAVISMTFEALAKLLDLPSGMSIVGVKDRDEIGAITIKVLSTHSKKVPEGGQPPLIMHGQQEWTGTL